MNTKTLWLTKISKTTKSGEEFLYGPFISPSLEKTNEKAVSFIDLYLKENPEGQPEKVLGDDADVVQWFRQFVCTKDGIKITVMPCISDIPDNMEIEDFLNPEEIKDIFRQARKIMQVILNFQMEISKTQNEIDEKIAECMRPDSGIEWAKNEDGRKVQKYQLTKELQDKLSAQNLSLANAENALRRVNLVIKEHETIMEYFKIYVPEMRKLQA